MKTDILHSKYSMLPWRSAHTISTSLLLLFILTLSGCDSNSIESADDLAVIEAFLFAGEPVEHIQVTSTIPFSSTDTVGTPINDAQIRLIKNEISYALSPSGSNGTYHYAGDDLNVEPGDQFSFVMDYLGQTITAETTVPPAPQEVTLDTTIFEVPSSTLAVEAEVDLQQAVDPEVLTAQYL